MNQKELKDLIEFLIEKDISEFELERGDVKVRVKRGESEARLVPTATLGMPTMAAPLAITHAHGAGSAPAATAGSSPAVDEQNLFIVKSPIVGTFYESPSPGSPPFVAIGDSVSIGQVLCIIEAMKLMNEIESEAAGEVVKKLVANGQPVEYGQPLFAIRKS
jgi:acetyl-CoA carboxylase biotin carboxyl carrier protein